MINDKLGQISLDRKPRNDRQKKSRKTQKLVGLANINSYSLSAVERYTKCIYTLTSDDVFINYEGANPKNDIKRNTGFSFGNIEKDNFSSFDDHLIDYKEKVKNFESTDAFLTERFTKKEEMNSRCDILRRNYRLTENSPFLLENIDFVKSSVGEVLPGKKSTSNIVSNSYENRDIKDPFIDDSSLNLKSGIYISRNNYYNNGSNTPFADSMGIKRNTIVNETVDSSQYYGSKDFFATMGFINKLKKPESIAFGGLKR